MNYNKKLVFFQQEIYGCKTCEFMNIEFAQLSIMNPRFKIYE